MSPPRESCAPRPAITPRSASREGACLLHKRGRAASARAAHTLPHDSTLRASFTSTPICGRAPIAALYLARPLPSARFGPNEFSVTSTPGGGLAARPRRRRALLSRSSRRERGRAARRASCLPPRALRERPSLPVRAAWAHGAAVSRGGGFGDRSGLFKGGWWQSGGLWLQVYCRSGCGALGCGYERGRPWRPEAVEKRCVAASLTLA